jgi:hypothetical protein
MKLIAGQIQSLKADSNNLTSNIIKKFNKVDLKTELKWAENNKAYFLIKDSSEHRNKEHSQLKDTFNQFNF